MMSWKEFHQISEDLSGYAANCDREGLTNIARFNYGQAAEAELKALECLKPEQKRTIGITVVSAVSLLIKAGETDRAKSVARQWLESGLLPDFAVEELRTIGR